jgi:hypothetical protein
MRILSNDESEAYRHIPKSMKLAKMGLESVFPRQGPQIHKIALKCSI